MEEGKGSEGKTEMPEMARYTYKSTVSSYKLTIEVNRGWAEVLEEEDNLEKNRNRKETRRHEPLNPELLYKGQSINDVEEHFRHICLKEMLEQAALKLTPKQRSVIDAIYRRGLTLTECAMERGVTVSTVNRLHTAALRKLRRVYPA